MSKHDHRYNGPDSELLSRILDEAEQRFGEDSTLRLLGEDGGLLLAKILWGVEAGLKDMIPKGLYCYTLTDTDSTIPKRTPCPFWGAG